MVSLLEHLIGKGKDVRVYDPHISVEDIYGTNRDFLLNAIPHIGRLMQTSVDGVLGWADHLIVAQKPSPQLAARVRAFGLPVLDIVHSTDNWAVPALPADMSH